MSYLFIPGIPQPQPRPRARAITHTKRGKYGKPEKVTTATVYSPSLKWRKTVAAELRKEPRELINAPAAVGVALRFYLPRPKGHYGTGRNAGKVKPSKLGLPVSVRSGDLDNLAKAVLDECNGVLFTDDAQVTQLKVEKWYADGKRGPGVDLGWWRDTQGERIARGEAA